MNEEFSAAVSIVVATCSAITRIEGWYGGHLKLHKLEQSLYSLKDFLSFDPCTMCILIAICSQAPGMYITHFGS